MGSKGWKKLTCLSVLLFLSIMQCQSYAAVVWTAYNDCLTNPLGFTQSNVTRWTIYNNNTSNYTGPLKNYISGSTTGMPTVTFSMAVGIVASTGGGGNPSTGTPAYNIFGGIIDFSPNILSYSSAGWTQEIEFSNLNPSLTYTFVGTAIRTTDYPLRQTLVTISEHDSATNNSSTGDMIVSISPTRTIFKAGNNTSSGDVVRWDNIAPGADGKFKIRTEAATSEYKAYAINGFMLQAIGPDNQPPMVNAGTDTAITLPVFKAAMNATVTDDGLGNPNGYLGYQWSLVNGPGAAAFVPNANVEDPEVQFELDQPGAYVLRLTATDGAFSRSDDVRVTVNPPVCPVGDLNSDCLVDFQDLQILVLQWLQIPAGNADLTDNGSVDLADYYWLAGTWQENQQKGALQVTINPESVRGSGARWRVDAGVWRPSGDIAQGLSVGAHTVEFEPVEDFDAPANQNVNVLYNQIIQACGTYVPHLGSLQVNISPAEVVSGARWRRVGQTEWRTSGSREDGILVGPHYVEFGLVSGWLKPGVREVMVSNDTLTTASGVYTDLGTISLRINEFMADNSTTTGIHDVYGDYDDWIELYNMSDSSIDLGGLYIADDTTKWLIPTGFAAQTTVPSGGYIILWADNETPEGPLHLPFKLSAGGDAITLYQADGTTVIDSISFGAQVYNHSYGRFPDGANDWYFFTPPTFKAQNSQAGIANRVADTKFSPDRGFFTSPFTVIITCDTPGASIYYTTDQSDPINPNGTPTATAVLYSEITKPNITTTTCLRAAAVKTGLIPTNIDTQTYIFLDDVFQQATNPSTGAQVIPAGYPTTWPGGTFSGAVTGDYQVDPDIVNHSNPENRLTTADMQAVPTICMTMKKEHWFDASIGIYVNEYLMFNGEAKEYPCSFEYFDPAGSGKSIQQNCAIAIQGGFSGNGTSLDRWKTYKLSMRPRFKQVTDEGVVTGGGSKLSSRIFPDSPVKDFDTIVLDAVLGYAWTHPWNQPARYVQDQCTADFHNATGGYSPHGVFVHLYINGLYWGMYYLHERPDHSWAAEMFGGAKEEYDALKHNRTGVVNNGIGGSGATSNYDAMLTTASNAGANPTSSVAWQALEQQLDVDRLITYLMTNWFTGNTDWPGKNWYATHRIGGQWRYHSWDAENTFKSDNENRVGQSPDTIHYRLLNHVEYKMRWADLIHKHFHHGGPLSYPRSNEIYQARVAEINQAIRGESARWGDNRYNPAKTRLDWLAISPQNGGYFPTRSDTVFNQLKSAGLYPNTLPPDFSVNGLPQYGGYTASGDSLTITNPNGTGTIWYMLNGQDPRLPGGAINSGALQYSGNAIPLTHSVHVMARVRNGSEWSALSEAVFAVGPVAESLRITELMYHPADAPVSDPNAEYIELRNTGGTAINLALVQFTNGVHLELPYLQLAAGAFAVVVKDPVAFAAQYDTSGITVVPLAYTGSLDNGGERIVLTDALGKTIHDFSYKDSWYPLTDGDGFSLSILDPLNSDLTLWDQKIGWRASTAAGGSPGTNEIGLAPGSILINELLAHSHETSPETSPDWIELYNTTAQSVFIDGWFLSDDADDPNKYTIPDNTEIPAGGYVVFYEDQGFGSAFALSENGETLYLTSGDGGQITGYQTSQQFDASLRGVSMGRYVRSDGETDFVAMSSPTVGTENNAYPVVGPIVISEIQYNPAAANTGDEYLELHNISSQAVTLQDTVDTEIAEGVFQQDVVSWSFTDGIDFSFPADTQIPAGGFLIIAKNPTAFSAYYTSSLPVGTQVLGPFENDTALSNGGEKIRLCRPGEQPLGQPRSWIRVDQVTYDDVSPWPTTPDGGGASLQRMNYSAYGNDPNNWTAGNPAPGQ